MEERALGRSGLIVSRLGLGTMTWGRETEEDDASEQLTTFRDAGGTLVDTADVYVGGESERVLGRLLRSVVRRDEIVLATKATGRTGPGAMGKGASRGHLLSALDASLRRLQTDHIDLWQLHAWDPDVPIDETLAALDAAVSSGKVRYVGVSNYAAWQSSYVAAWQRALPTRVPIVSNQLEYSLLRRDIDDVVDACRHGDVGLLPWGALGRGVLTGKYRNGTPSDSRAASEDTRRYVELYLTDDAASIVEAVATAADGLGTSPLCVALAWVRDRPGVAAPIVGARTVGQLAGALESEQVELPDKIRAALDDISQ